MDPIPERPFEEMMHKYINTTRAMNAVWEHLPAEAAEAAYEIINDGDAPGFVLADAKLYKALENTLNALQDLYHRPEFPGRRLISLLNMPKDETTGPYYVQDLARYSKKDTELRRRIDTFLNQGFEFPAEKERAFVKVLQNPTNDTALGRAVQMISNI